MDSDATIRLALEHLAILDRRHAGYVGHQSEQSTAKQHQRERFLDSARSRGWTTAFLDVPSIPSEERKRLAAPAAERELTKFLRGLPRPAVMFCDDDYVAALVCAVAKHLRLDVPSDLAVLGYFDMAVARFAVPTISSLPGSGHLVGAAGMRLLADLLAGGKPPTKTIVVAPPAVVIRESTGARAIRNDDIRRAHDLIERFACKGLTVDQLLSRISLSQKTLNKRYDAAYGRTPGAAIRQVHAAKAKELLATTDLSVSRVADMCGFEERSNFNLFFKREVGCTPGDYRSRSR